MIWYKNLKGKIKFNEPLRKHTSFKVGGCSLIWFEPKDTRDLINCLRLIKNTRIPYLVIGNGTNLLVKDDGFKGVVIRLSSASFKHIRIKKNIFTVGGGLSLFDLIKFLINTNLTDYEFLAGIPGTVGGALVMNAGITENCKRFNISDIVYKIKALNRNGEILILDKDDANFGYRKSNLERYIILEAQLKLKSRDKTDSKNRIRDFLLTRRIKQDISKPNAGCIFRNPSKNLPAAKLIDKCGLKGRRCGGAMISNKHANFILNFNDATADDIIKLIRVVKDKVKDKFRIRLKEEIKIV